jgi:membrane protease YdiL (CAAX protease family)
MSGMSAGLIRTRTSDSLAWMRRDLPLRLVPFAAAVTCAYAAARPRWLGLSPGRMRLQLGFGLLTGAALFPSALALRLLLSRRLGGSMKVPADSADAALQGLYYLLNAPLEEAFFRGLLQGGLTALAGPRAGLGAATAAYVLYHRLGGWAWPDVFATLLIGAPLALAYRRLPGPPSLLGVSLAHCAATCGFLGPGPWLASRLGII